MFCWIVLHIDNGTFQNVPKNHHKRIKLIMKKHKQTTPTSRSKHFLSAMFGWGVSVGSAGVSSLHISNNWGPETSLLFSKLRLIMHNLSLVFG